MTAIRNRLMERNKPCQCAYCHQDFVAVRYNAQFCSPRCRKAHSRWQKKIQEHLHVALSALDALKEYRGTSADGEALCAVRQIATRATGIRDYGFDV